MLQIGKKLFEAGRDDISNPVIQGGKIYFSATFSGIDNIYCYDTGDEQVYQVSSAPFGAFHPQISADGLTLFYSNYSSSGYGATSLELDQGLWLPLEDSRDHSEQLDYKPSIEEEKVLELVEDEDSLELNSRRYRKMLHLFNVHSWLPLYFDYLNPELELDPEHLPVSPGISLISQNHLSTAVSQVGYEYRDGYHLFHSGIQLKGRYPVLNLYFDYGGKPDVLVLAPGDSALTLPTDLGFTAQTYVPIRLNTGKYLTLIQPRIDYNFRRDIQFNESQGTYQTGGHYLHYSLYTTSYLRKGRKDILPRVGVSANAGYYHAPKSQIFGAVSTGGIIAYLPGPLKHQTIKLSASYQKQFPLDMSRPAFINLISPPRGIHGVFGEVLTRYSADWDSPFYIPILSLALFYT